MNELVISSCIEEVSDSIIKHCLFMKDELKRGTTPERYEFLSLMNEAVEKAIDMLKMVPDFMRTNENYADEHLYPLIKDTYAIKKDFEGAEPEIALPKLMIMSGFIAITLNLADIALKIFEALKKFRPESEYPLIGIAYAYLSKGSYEEAIETLRDQALKINPRSDLARAFLALSYTFSKKSEEMKKLAGEIIDNDDDKNAIAIARALLADYY
jgi:tetratricopeptide (TPR) repeat protein